MSFYAFIRMKTEEKKGSKKINFLNQSSCAKWCRKNRQCLPACPSAPPSAPPLMFVSKGWIRVFCNFCIGRCILWCFRLLIFSGSGLSLHMLCIPTQRHFHPVPTSIVCTGLFHSPLFGIFFMWQRQASLTTCLRTQKVEIFPRKFQIVFRIFH